MSELAVALAQAGQFRAARALANDIQDRPARAQALCGLAAALAAAGDRRASLMLDYAAAVVRAIQDDLYGPRALETLANTLAQAGRFADALQALEHHDIEQFIQKLAEWAPWFEQVEPGSAVVVLREAISVAGWARPDWRAAHGQLSAALDEE